MDNNKALTFRPNLTPQTWEMISQIAPVMYTSRLFGVNSSEACTAIMLKGFELGMPFTAAFEFIQVIQGKPTLSPRGALAVINQSGQLAGIKIEDRQKDGKPSSCFVWMKRANGFEYSLEFTMDDAVRTGQVKSSSAWSSYPANMLRWRCIGFVADVVFPDIIGGLKRADELGAVIDENGDVIEGQWNTVTVSAASTPQPEPVVPVVPVISLEDLLAAFDAETIIVANEGKIPGTDAEVAAVAQKLGVL